MKDVVCSFCNRKFKRKESQIKSAIRHYCSVYCSEQGRKRGKIVRCFVCKKTTYKKLKALKLSKSGEYFCSHKCSNIFIGRGQRAENHPNWAGGIFSYKNLLKRTDLKKECILCGKNDSRILCVHHLDKDRGNNKISNLVWLCRNCHFLVHAYRKEII